MDNTAINAFIITFFAGAATSIGAGISFFARRNDFKVFALGLSFSAGVMLFVSFMDIMPLSIEHMQNGNHAFEGLGVRLGYIAAIAMFFIGMVAAALIDYFVPEHPHNEMAPARSEKHADLQSSPRGASSKAQHTAMLTAIALAVHNFPEGLSVFVSSLEDTGAGIAVGFAILLHNIPEGVSVALPIYNAEGSKSRAFWTATMSGMAEPLGAACAYLLLMPFLTPVTIGALLSLTAGIMVYISLDELLPMAREYGEAHHGIIGAALGMAVMAISSVFFM